MGEAKVSSHGALTKCKSGARTYNKKRRSDVQFLADEIIFHILVWLPANILVNKMRYVCKQWYSIIKDPLFVKEQLLACSIDALCFQCYRERTVYFAHFGRKKARLSKFNGLPSFSLKVLSTCDGLVLFSCDKGRIHIANPLTKQLVTLPPISLVLTKKSKITYSIGGACSTMEYKVVFTCYCQKQNRAHCMVITLGKNDGWRSISIPWLPRLDLKVLLIKPVLVGKFLHWVTSYHSYVMTLDVESEILYKSRAPDKELTSRRGGSLVKFLMRGEYMTCMMGLHETKVWEVWAFSNNIKGKWKKLFDIDLRPQMHRLRRMSKLLFRQCDLFPVAWMNNDEIVVFRANGSPDPFIAHNIKTGYTFQLRFHNQHACYGFRCPFAFSLVSPS